MIHKQNHTFPRIWVLSLPLVLALISLGCGLSQALADITSSNSQPTPTRVLLPTFTPTTVNMVTIEVSSPGSEPAAVETTEPEQPPVVAEPESVLPLPTPSPSPPPTEEPAPPADGPVTVSVQQNMNVRGGPGTNYPVIGPAPAGASSQVLGRNADNSWVQVEYPPGSGGTGWVYASLVKINGNLESVPIVSAPPPPAAQPQPQPENQEPPPPAPTPAPQYQFTPAAWSTIGNEAIVHFRGTIRDHAGNPVNGFSVLLDNGSWSVLSHPTGASHHYPDRPEGEWDVVIPDVSTGVGWWKITVVSYDCPDFNTVFDAQCKQFTRLSEDVPVSVTWPDETIIWADWTCNYDCDKGLYVQSYRRP
jgi:hypothetical protein